MNGQKPGVIKIQMLGDFSIASGEGSVRELTKRAPKFWRVLQYLIAFRNQQISREDLISAIWPDGKSGDPENAMRNMVFRIRTALVESGMEHAKDMLIRSGEGYCWNSKLDCYVDSEEFERLYKEAASPEVPRAVRLDKLIEAIALYKGDFLPTAGFEMWAIPLTSYYRSLFFKCVHMAIDMMMEDEKFSDVELICKKALQFDPFDEVTHEYHLKSLIAQKKQKLALDEYQRLSTLFFEELGVSPSENLKELYLKILETTEQKQKDIIPLVKNWSDSGSFEGAYFCESEVFRIIYQVEARLLNRNGQSAFLVSISAEDLGRQKKAALAMRQLQDTIQNSLRKGDLFTRLDVNQYLLLLQNLAYEDCKLVSARIQRKYAKNNRSVQLKTKIQPVKPLE